MLRRNTPSSAQLTGGDLSVDILHTEDSVQIGDGTNLLGSFPLVGALRSLPVANAEFATNATLTGGTAKFQIYDPGSTDGGVAEVDLVGTERALKVSVISSVGGGGGGTAATDSAAFTATATQGTPIMGAFDDVTPDALAEGEMGIIRATSDRALHVAVQNSVAVTGTFWQATQPVSGTFWQATQPVSIASMPSTPVTGTFWQATQPVSGTVAISSIAAGDNNIGNVDVVSMPTVAVTGTFWQATQPVSGTFWQATQPVSGTVAATQSGTWNIGSITTLPSIPAGTNNIGDVDVLSMPTVTVQGAAAHDAVISGNPVPLAGRANNANPTEVAAGDASYIMTDLSGRVVTTSSPRALVAQATGSQATITEATMLAAGGVGVFHDLTQLILTNSHATDAALVQIRDTTAGAIVFQHSIPANSGMVAKFDPPFNQTTANTNWTIDLNAAVATVYYTVQAVKRT